MVGLVSPRTHCPRTRGFSLLELMNFVALALVLGGVAMLALARYVRHGKTAEARESITRLASGAAEYYNRSDSTQPSGAAAHNVHAMRHFPPSSRVPVPEDPLAIRGKRYQSNSMDWAVSPWRDIGFNLVQPQCYQYAFEAQGAGAAARALVTAEGDLDGDGARSKYALAVTPDESLTAVVAPEMERTEPEE